MKAEIGFLEKIKICYRYLRNKESGLMEICPNCGSTNIQKNHHWEKQMEKGSEYHASYKCRKCGAESSVREDWYYVDN